MMRVAYATDAEFQGWALARPAALALIQRFAGSDILEIGAGANPTLTLADVQQLGVRYTTNDIADAELARAGAGFQTLCHDFSQQPPARAYQGAFDVVFSRMVNEHVRDGRQYYRNIASVLRPGGVTFHWFSTLFALPFLVNRLVPEALAERLLALAVPDAATRHRKFPAHYSWGRGPSRRMIQAFHALGFEVLEYHGYFGHQYYRTLSPWLQALEDRKARWLVRHPVPLLTSYAHLVMRRR